MSAIKLTQFSKGSGCGCKIPPDQLSQLLQNSNHEIQDLNLLVGNKTNDDAAVYKINDSIGIISTTDFFAPVVNTAYDFGRIAACNAISDIYAMGGKPIMALGILGWPLDKLPLDEARQVMDGARSICYEAGISLCGGHSIETTEPLFGLAVTGFAPLTDIKTNGKAQEGDYLFLSKPLGLGILSAALKREIIKPDDEVRMTHIMTSLNTLGLALSKLKGVHALTDITGFGLIGHLSEIAKASAVSAVLNLKHIPKIEGIEFYTQQFCYPGITTKNLNAFRSTTQGLENGLDFLWLCDPQTSGGLLIAVAESALSEFNELCKAHDHFKCLHQPIGRIVKQSSSLITLHSED